MTLTFPEPVRHGATVMVVSPSSATAGRFPRRLARSIQALTDRGFHVTLAPHAASADEPGPSNIHTRVEDLHRAFTDPAVDVVMTSIGGWASSQLLDHLDFGLIAAHPKHFIGYSDTTSLHMGIVERARVSTTYGPALMPQFGEYSGVDDYTWSWLSHRLLLGPAIGRFTQSLYRIEEPLAWDKDDSRDRERQWSPVARTLLPGEATGPLLAANLETLMSLAGTPWWPDLTGRILFVELSDSAAPWQAWRALYQLTRQTTFSHAAGLALGWVPSVTGINVSALHDYLASLLTSARIPVAVDLPFGHCDPVMSLPQGLPVHLNCHPDRLDLTFLPAPSSS